ncbi:hypothetical protein MAE02_40280 [Microvirga aerophila]|uniref:Glycosyltransferase RgtA/B/C/D-like domain-containing protein n=2 Tax=Microvirga aerophila TaxID=670291 RepID=A0A512BWJ4_9HYPH|nr:hypothetical protein MAE02_40280 [Microvirga aerophila]
MILIAIVLAGWLLVALSGSLSFDDAYMFYRYAINLRKGLGLSWNPDGVPTYGLTSQLWVFVVLPFTWLPLHAGAALQIASWVTGTVGLALLGFTAVRHAKPSPQSTIVAACAVLALALNPAFAFHLTTGMDTLLSFLANVVLMLVLLEYLVCPSTRRAFTIGLAAFAAVLARPDNVLCALGVPFLVWLLNNKEERRRDVIGLVGLPVLLTAADLTICRWYFGTPLPLGFYAKSVNGYVGFQSEENPFRYMLAAAPCWLPFLALLIAGAARGQGRLLVACLLPIAATLLYLCTVRQVMGFVGRYYIPFLPYLVLPAVLSAATVLVRDGPEGRFRFVKALLVLLSVHMGVSIAWVRLEPAYLEFTRPHPVPVRSPAITSSASLPLVPWFEAIARLAEDVVTNLPAGASLAASEVGYLGAVAPNTVLIDLVGLNDTRISRNGFSLDDLLARAPDLIWLPHLHYTGLRAQILAEPRFHDRYQVIVGALNYGLALRRDSPHRKRIHDDVAGLWMKLYPAHRLEDYVVWDESVKQQQPGYGP